MRVLVCGDRNWTNYDAIETRLARFPPDTVIIHGANGRKKKRSDEWVGADMIADTIARRLSMTVEPYPAEWDKYADVRGNRGNPAGPIRNRQMLSTLNPRRDRVVAFHRCIERSRGTKDCVTEARRRGIPVEVIG